MVVVNVVVFLGVVIGSDSGNGAVISNGSIMVVS